MTPAPKNAIEADCYRVVREAKETMSPYEYELFLQRVERGFRQRYEQNLKAALSKPVPDMNEVRHWKAAIAADQSILGCPPASS